MKTLICRYSIPKINKFNMSCIWGKYWHKLVKNYVNIKKLFFLKLFDSTI